MESILNSIKKLLGIQEEYTHFDTDLIMHINTVLTILTQLGVGPSCGFLITGPETTWSEYLNDEVSFESVKTYIHLRVKMLFDPPQNSSVMESMNRMISELEFRLNVNAENKEEIQNGV